MKKKTLIILLAVAMVFTLALTGCGGGEKKSDGKIKVGFEGVLRGKRAAAFIRDCPGLDKIQRFPTGYIAPVDNTIADKQICIKKKQTAKGDPCRHFTDLQ